MIYLIKNFGLTSLGLGFLLGCATLENRLIEIEHKLDVSVSANAVIASYGVALPEHVLSEPLTYKKAPVPQRKPAVPRA